MAFSCVRNTVIEDWHIDGRISQEEMKSLMKVVVNRLFTVISNATDRRFAMGLHIYSSETRLHWDQPEIDESLLSLCLGFETRWRESR